MTLFIPRADPLLETQVLAVAETIREKPPDHPLGGFGRMPGDGCFQALVKGAVDVGEFDGGAVDCCRNGHYYLS
jgi:hypothetical protein